MIFFGYSTVFQPREHKIQLQPKKEHLFCKKLSPTSTSRKSQLKAACDRPALFAEVRIVSIQIFAFQELIERHLQFEWFNRSIQSEKFLCTFIYVRTSLENSLKVGKRIQMSISHVDSPCAG
jgi:hypothetical protein